MRAVGWRGGCTDLARSPSLDSVDAGESGSRASVSTGMRVSNARQLVNMRIVLVAPDSHSVSIDGEWTTEGLKQEVEQRLGLPAGVFWLQWKGRVLRNPLQLSDLSQVQVQLSLPGGYYSKEDIALSEQEMHQLICRRCYCRNSYDRRSCRKCGHPDLRSRKITRRQTKVSNPNRPHHKP